MMHYSKMAIYLIMTPWGTNAMGFEITFNQETRKEFKRSINYPALATRQVPERVVHLNWQDFLKNIVDDDGREWIGAPAEPTLGHWGEGELRATLKSSKGAAIVLITSLAGQWQQRLDHLVWTESLTNRTEVNLKIVPGIDDLYLVPRDNQGTSSSTFLYGNICVSIKQWDAVDIDALAKAIHRLMQEHSQPGPVKHPPSFKLSSDRTRLSPGEKVSIKVEGRIHNWHSQWTYNQPQQLLGDEVEYIERIGNTFFFKALKRGEIQIPFTAMNTQTLYIESQSAGLVID